MFAAISAHHRNNYSFARGDCERRLFRSLSSIHHSPPVQSSLRRRSVGVDTMDTTPLSSRNSISNNRMSSPTLVADKSPFSHDELPPLPFNKDENIDTANNNEPQPQPQSQGHSLATNTNKFQRRYSPLTADMAREMVTGLATEMRHQRTPRQYLTKARSNMPPPPLPVVPTESHVGFRQDYFLGDTARSPSHMITNERDQSSIEATTDVRSLKKHDFAFVKRSDGTYSYAMLAKRSVEPIKGKGKEEDDIATCTFEECVTFMISGVGTTKTIREKHWTKFVRCVRPLVLATRDDRDPQPSTSSLEQQHLTSEEYVGVHHTISQQHQITSTPVVLCEACLPEVCLPSAISFVRSEDFDDDECSLISSVSDRARDNAR